MWRLTHRPTLTASATLCMTFFLTFLKFIDFLNIITQHSLQILFTNIFSLFFRNRLIGSNNDIYGRVFFFPERTWIMVALQWAWIVVWNKWFPFEIRSNPTIRFALVVYFLTTAVVLMWEHIEDFSKKLKNKLGRKENYEIRKVKTMPEPGLLGYNHTRSESVTGVTQR